jgi:N-methylhydantoinase A/oxoprolinase/acetone carboxylase beta subunit
VETIHSGPAASAIGGRFISRLDEALVIDVGGTTTDIALIEAGQVAISEEGASVGDYKTAVKAANILSIALGGDSHIHLDRERKLVIGPSRVTPLAYLAQQHPDVKKRVLPLLQKPWGQVGPDQLEFWSLMRQPRGDFPVAGTKSAELVAMLSHGPLSVADILARLKLVHSVQLGADELLRQEIISRAGLTPTDLLHIRGDYAAWDVEMSEVAATLFCRVLGLEVNAFIPDLFEQAAEIITDVTLGFLTGKRLAKPTLPVERDMGRWWFKNSITPAHPQLETTIRLKVPIIGIGAPAGVFLQRVADILHTELVLPRYHHVANAVGAVAGSIMVSEEALVYPRFSNDGLDTIGYVVQTSEGRELIEELPAALAFARDKVRSLSWEGALRSGAHNPQVQVHEAEDGLDAYRIRARAMGNPRLA